MNLDIDVIHTKEYKSKANTVNQIIFVPVMHQFGLDLMLNKEATDG
jgi:hypothetical protein